MQELTVRAATHEPRFKTIQAAIQSLSDRQAVAQLDSKRVAGGHIIRTVSSDTELALHLSTDLTLRICAENGTVAWRIEDGPLAAFAAGAGAGAGSIRLRFEATNTEFLWERSRLAGALVGATVRRIFARDCWVFLYLDGQQPLLFDVVEEVSTKRCLLHWDVAG